jgi:hydrogenase maturation protein HypF
MPKEKITYQISINGVVQGVGFRPLIWRLAHAHQLYGEVFNNTEGVTIILQDPNSSLQLFLSELQRSLPAVARIDHLAVTSIPTEKLYTDFTISSSVSSSHRKVPVSPDLHVCHDCLRELFDPDNRRYLYPFINCTNCGPRFSIVKDLPYDRQNTTMDNFRMCSLCQQEYDNPADRRFHAQPNACPECGPQLVLTNGIVTLLKTGDRKANAHFFQTLSDLLLKGHILAIKSIGGFHLACDARNEVTVRNLRQRKYREDKPFAVMFSNLNSVQEYCYTSSAEEVLLQSIPHPIVILRKNGLKNLADSIAPRNNYLGAMLPYTPLHHLILKFCPHPLVMTSGNVSDEPIAFEDEDALQRLRGIADYFVIHSRPIFIRCDDSVTRVFDERAYPIRCSRGFAPCEIPTSVRFATPILACGAEQKNTIALACDERIIISQHIGDLKNYNTYQAFLKNIEHLKRLYDVHPKVVAHDQHPEYLSTKYALELAENSAEPITRIGIQHHHAHAASCMIDNNLNEPAIGIVLDGTGYGSDGTIWGGELLRVEYGDFERLGHFDYVPMPGGQAAIDHPWQMALSYLVKVFGKDALRMDLPFLSQIPFSERLFIWHILEENFNAPLTSSCGRLFDGVAALTGLCLHANYEGQPAIEFEQTITMAEVTPYRLVVDEQYTPFRILWGPMIQEIIADLESKCSVGTIALKFHFAIVQALFMAAQLARKLTGINKIVLSGGVFMNMFLLENLVQRLRQARFEVFTHQNLPCNDGGIAAGQTVIANAKIGLKF